MKYSAEEKFLLDACVLSKPVLSGGYDASRLDWEKIVSSAEVHWLGFYLDKIIKTHRLKIENKYLKRIERLKERERARHSYYRRKLPVILRALNKAKVNYVLLKGGYLAFKLFPAGARFLSDIDILVQKEDKAKAEEALFKKGFKEDKNKSTKVTTVLNDVNGLEVDLDTELGILKKILPAEELLQNTVKLRLLGEKAPVLNHEYNLLHLALHTSMTHSFYNISKLVDINEYLKKYKVDMARLEAIARQKGVFRAAFLPVAFTGILWHNKTGLSYNIEHKRARYFIKYNLRNALKRGYDSRSAFYGYVIPVLLADSFELKFRLIKDYIVKKVKLA